MKPHLAALNPNASHDDMANAIRFLSADAVEQANSGHPGMPMGMADVATVLFSRVMKFDSRNPDWPDRDRFVLSAGHGSMLLYSLLYLTGYEDMTLDEIKNFRQLGAKTAGHPEYGHAKGIETTTGPLGQGLTTSVGMALAERMLNARFGDALVDHHTWVIAGDGCLMEGVSQEAISFAGHQKLEKLVVLWDNNEICIDGKCDMATTEDMKGRFEAAGWTFLDVDGHDQGQIAEALATAREGTGKPVLISCRTIIGKGAPTKGGTEKVHGSPLGPDEMKAAREAMGWPHGAFEVPETIVAAWREAGARGSEERRAWEERLRAQDKEKADAFDRCVTGRLPLEWDKDLDAYKKKVAEERPKLATRKASQQVLETLTGRIDNLVGGSADLTGSNLTKTKHQQPVTPGDWSGTYIHYGVREHGMAAFMNGIALHGGFIPYGGTFLVFTDYARPAMRLSALMGIRVIYVMTHDSIGLGEDGPTHQPVEHLMSLRAMPNMLVMRPCDPVETAECYQLALSIKDQPTTLSLTRQGVPVLRAYTPENQCARGGYVLSEPEDGSRDCTLIASGSEVEIAMTAQVMLAEVGVKAAVVSMPCWELFDDQPTDYRWEVLGKDVPRVAVEAGGAIGWERYTGLDGAVIGLRSFGNSAPAEQLYDFYGVTPQAVADAALQRVKARRK